MQCSEAMPRCSAIVLITHYFTPKSSLSVQIQSEKLNPSHQTMCCWRSHVTWVNCCACMLYSVLYVWVYVVNWFFVWVVGALMVSVVLAGLPVWCLHLSEGRANQHYGNWAYQRSGKWANQWLTQAAWITLYKFTPLVLYSVHCSISSSLHQGFPRFCTVQLRQCYWLSSHLTSPKIWFCMAVCCMCKHVLNGCLLPVVCLCDVCLLDE